MTPFPQPSAWARCGGWTICWPPWMSYRGPSAISLVRIANDLRLLSSGPTTGLDEIRLPAVQPGSSIMPGKVNPVLAEMLDMAMFHVQGCDHTVALAAQAGQLELNVMMPIIAHNLFEAMQVMIGAVRAFTDECVVGITAQRE